jgi:hypothetical protein
MSATVLTIKNNHGTDSGDPPNLKIEQSYTSYFENVHREQWVFQCDYGTGKATLYGGDIGWDNLVPVDIHSNIPAKEIVLCLEERVWLIVCCLVARKIVDHRYKTTKL